MHHSAFNFIGKNEVFHGLLCSYKIGNLGIRLLQTLILDLDEKTINFESLIIIFNLIFPSELKFSTLNVSTRTLIIILDSQFFP